MSDLFKDLGFLIVGQHLESKPLIFKKSIYRKHKATLFYSLKSALSKANKNYVVSSNLRIILLEYDDFITNDSKITEIRNITVNSLGIKSSSDIKKIRKIPVLTSKWASDSIQSNKRLETSKYLVDLRWDDYKPDDIVDLTSPVSSPPMSPILPSSIPSSPNKVDSNHRTESKENRRMRLSQEKQLDLLNNHSHTDTDVSLSLPSSPIEYGEPLTKRRRVNADNFSLESNDSYINTRTIDILSQMAKEYALEAKTGIIGFKAMSYRKAIESIKKADKPIMTYEDAIKLPNVGQKIAKKIEEIVKTGNLHQLDNFKVDEQHSALKLFSSVNGIGTFLAHEWYNKGYRTLKDVVDNEQNLPRVVKNGLLYHEDWILRIPREEVLKHYEFVRDIAKKVNPEIKLELLGSYCRGAKDCGDIDFMMYIKDCNDSKVLRNMLYELVTKLTEINYIKCDLVKVYPDMSKYMGGGNLSKLNNICRRVDIIYTPYSQLGSARLYFIGNDLFNRALRQLAKDKSMALNQHGLFGGKDKAELLESFDERRILKLLDVEWREYTERNLGSISDLDTKIS